MSVVISAPNMVGSLHDICHTHHFPTVLSTRGVKEAWEGVSAKVPVVCDRFAGGLDGQLACWSDLSRNGFLPWHVDRSVVTWVPSEALPTYHIHMSWKRFSLNTTLMQIDTSLDPFPVLSVLSGKVGAPRRSIWLRIHSSKNCLFSPDVPRWLTTRSSVSLAWPESELSCLFTHTIIYSYPKNLCHRLRRVPFCEF